MLLKPPMLTGVGPAVRSYLVHGLSLAAALLLLSASATAQQPAPPPTSSAIQEFDDGKFTAFSFYVENDLLQPRENEDRNYTGGFGFQFSGSFIRRARLDAPLRGLDRLTGLSKKHDAWDRRFYTLLVFGTGFTPDELNTAAPVLDDRPYASLLGVSVRRLAVNDASFDEAWSSELVVAMLGLHQARNLQTWLHRRLRARSGEETPYDPLGWHNQISDGGEPTALYRIGYERRLLGDPSGPDNRKHFQLTGGFGGSVGYYTNANLILNTRVGWFTSDFWEFTPGAMNAATQNLGTGHRRQTPEWELFLFAGVRPRLNIYNALLQGQFRKSVHTVDIRHEQLEWDLGMAVFIPALRLQVTWNALTGRTSELTAGRPRTHTWGSLVGTYAWPVK
jgi:hypothetical protein